MHANQTNNHTHDTAPAEIDLSSQEQIQPINCTSSTAANCISISTTAPSQVEATTCSDAISIVPIQSHNRRRKYSDGDFHSSAFTLITMDITLKRVRSKSFSVAEPTKTTQIFHPVILKSEKEHVCSNSLCSICTEQGEMVKLKNKKCWLCLKCLSLFQKEQYCFYCFQIYEDTSNIGAVVDGLEWIQCESCMKWVL